MGQFLRKRALAAVLSAAVLVGLAQPAVAATFNPTYPTQVTPNGVGDLLIFGYWTTVDRDSLVAITNAFGGQTQRFVHIRIREGVDSVEVANFTICLSPGDVWTAAITSTGAGTSALLIGNPGSCDDAVLGGQGLTPPPAPGDPPLDLGTDFGYITAYTLECSTNLGGLGLCPGLGTAPNGNDDGGDDTLMGVATLVSATAGFSSSYNATSFIGFDAINESASIRNANNTGRAHSLYTTILGGAPTVVAGATPISAGSARTDVANALANEGGVSKELLMGRWTAATIFNSSTDVVLTFPTGDYPGVVVGGDPVSIWIFDEDENFNFSPRSVILDWEVNICRFRNPSVTESGDTEFTCNGRAGLGGPAGRSVQGPGGTFESGWFRFINNNDRINGGIGDGTGVEFDNINAIPDSAFPVIGLVFSFFQGTQGIFDQSYPIQWAAITGLGGIGNPIFCSVFPFTGCNAFDIASQYQPYTQPDGIPFPPWQTGVGRNRRSNSGEND